MTKETSLGIDNYRELKEKNYYAVDKTLMIKEFLDSKKKVTLITRPRRFGKTLNISMMAEFFDITKDSRDIFEGTKIMETEYASYMNQYPVIFITFKDATGSKNKLISRIKKQFQNLFKYYRPILDNMEMDIFDKDNYQYINQELMNNTSSLENITDALLFLSNMLYNYYNKSVMIFIDEYDMPYNESYDKGYYEEIHEDLSSILSETFKGNSYLEYGLLTGIQRVAKENTLSKFNNPLVCTVSDNKYSQYFGFTENETRELLEYYNLSLNDNVKQMYDGYHIGNINVYNPWSILNYAETRELKPYWINTGSNKTIKSAMENADISFKNGFESLIEHGYLDTSVNMETSFYEESQTPMLWGLFINAGYLTVTQKLEFGELRIKIPNDEVVNEFKSLVADYTAISPTLLNDLAKGLLKEDPNGFFQSLRSILLIPSYYDYVSENSYHMLFLSLCIYLQGTHKPLSNREAGDGRSDVTLKSKTTKYPSYVIEFKYNKESENVDKLADEALDQIERKRYDAQLTGRIIHIGLGVHGKKVGMKWVVK
ncbi:MAG: ATP-binding protein [Erysipelotrichaceae bacterium]|nr:ATP-binding protein [Erysipelotrichaceae bacterium]